jgi:hypothetical protein
MLVLGGFEPIQKVHPIRTVVIGAVLYCNLS